MNVNDKKENVDIYNKEKDGEDKRYINIQEGENNDMKLKDNMNFLNNGKDEKTIDGCEAEEKTYMENI